MKERSVCLIGSGGQGVVFAATVLANALFAKGLYVAQLQNYGAEVRGGSVMAYVVFSESEVVNPFLNSFNVLIVLHDFNVSSWMKYLEYSNLVIVDDLLVSKNFCRAIKAPLFRKALEIGLAGRENVVALGFLAGLNVVDKDDLKKALMNTRDFEQNAKALEAGYELALQMRLKELQEFSK
ncbi:MAG: 2-oxoacid:acceptor oxidoreductase family protein [Sulfolobales archaeon]|nr:2-oxoacid:acceptor oxidoreductase family protein [Sulfolobales archaeon]MCX8199062.1 2-oxoacid:acceptor oxidoreductase family protein [Sulfolobales archaeon]MDW8170041.1 2-oxoacid:acceptor oxidoreductase family protein [Desulfurococcaceae archaeon]